MAVYFSPNFAFFINFFTPFFALNQTFLCFFISSPEAVCAVTLFSLLFFPFSPILALPTLFTPPNLTLLILCNSLLSSALIFSLFLPLNIANTANSPWLFSCIQSPPSPVETHQLGDSWGLTQYTHPHIHSPLLYSEQYPSRAHHTTQSPRQPTPTRRISQALDNSGGGRGTHCFWCTSLLNVCVPSQARLPATPPPNISHLHLLIHK